MSTPAPNAPGASSAPGDVGDVDDLESAPPAPKKRFRISSEDRGLLFGIPLLVVLILAGWTIWRLNADLDDVETRQLAWSNVLHLTWQHIVLVVISALIVMVLAVPVGVLLTRGQGAAKPSRGVLSSLSRGNLTSVLTFAVMGIANAGQAAPIIGVVVLLAIWLGFGTPVAVLALVIYAFLPVLSNTITGLRSIDPSLKESARGMGMSSSQVLFRVELPLAVPVIMTGARTALVLLVGGGAFATFIDAGGLGTLINTGITLYRFSILTSGAILVAVLALIIEWVGRVMELVFKPKGL